MLNKLVEYAQKNLSDSEPGFTTRNVRWLADISSDGKLVNVIPLGNEKGAEQTPKCPEMHNMNAGGRAHFLVETLQTVSLFFKANEDPKKVESSREKQIYFRGMINQAATVAPLIHSIAMFMEDEEQLGILRDRLAKEKAKPTDWLRWSIAGNDPLHQSTILDWWRCWREADQGKGESGTKPEKGKAVPEESGQGDMICFLTGTKVKAIATQPKITGLSNVGGLSMGDVMAGFDKDAFCSFGLEQASNAAMGEKSAREYVDALKHLIKNHSRKLANALVVHWFKESVRPEDDPLAFLYEPPEQTESAAQSSARQIL